MQNAWRQVCYYARTTVTRDVLPAEVDAPQGGYNMPARILVVEDERVVAKNLERSLLNNGYEIVGSVSSGEDALWVAQELKPDLVLMDIKLAGEVDGIEAADKMRACFDIPVVYITGYAEKEVFERVKKTEPYGYLGKPFTLLELRRTIETALYKHEADKRVRESERHYRLLIENLHAGVVVYRPDSSIELSNRVAARILGFAQDEMAGEKFLAPQLSFVRDDGSPMPQDEHPVNRVISSLEPVNNLVMGIDRPSTNDRIWVLVNAYPVLNEHDEFRSVVVTFVDITERKKTEEALRDSEQRLELALLGGDVGLWDWDVRTNQQFRNDKWFEILGYAPNEIESSYSGWKRLVHPDDFPRLQGLWLAHAQGLTDSYEAENRLLSKSGEWKWTLARGKIVERDENGKPVRVVGTTVDISERKRAEQELRESEERYRELFENSPFAFWDEDWAGVKATMDDIARSGVTDFKEYFEDHPESLRDIVRKVRIRDANRAGKELFGIVDSPLGDLPFDLALAAESLPTFVDDLVTMFRGERSVHSEVRMRIASGEEIDVAVRLAIAPGFEDTWSRVLVSTLDLTERKAMERALAESEERYRLVVDNAAQAIVVVQDQVCKFFNPKAIELSGYTEEEFLGISVMDLVHPDDRALAAARLQQRLAGGEPPGPVAYRFVDKQGGIRWIDINTVIINWQGRNAGLTFATDVTEQRRVERTLRESEERYRLLAENSMTGIYTHENGVFTYVNQRLADMMGYSVDEIVGEQFWEFVHADDREAIKERGLAISRGERLDPYVEFRVLCKNGDIKWFQVLSTPMSHHGHTANLGNVADITDRKRAEAALQESELWMRSIFDAMQDAVIILTPERTIMDINPAAEKMFGYRREEVVGCSVEIFHVDREHNLEFARKIRESFEKRSSAECEFQAKRKNGEIFPTEHRVSLLRDKNEEPIGIVSVVRDITEKREAEQTINASLREKEVMLREIHHRVKNNLSVIISLLGLQSEYSRESLGYDVFEELQERVRSMALAHEFLYQSENLADLKISDYVDGLVTHLVRSMADVGTDVEIRSEIEQVSFNLDTAIPLGFLLTELISNCLKHAFPKKGRGEIRLCLRSCGDGVFDLIVADNGVGMPDDIELDNPGSLGLDLVSVFVTQLQGEIEIHRTRGTEIRIRFKELARRRAVP